MSDKRLFYVEKNDSWHTYEFLAQRQQDPNWRAAFLAAEALIEQEDRKRKRRNFTVLLIAVPVVVLGLLTGLYFYGSATEETVTKRAISLNQSTSSTTALSQTSETTSTGQVLSTPYGEQVTVLRVLPNGERVIKEGASPSDLNGDGVLTFEELSQVEEQANQPQTYQQPQPETNPVQQTPAQSQVPSSQTTEASTQSSTTLSPEVQQNSAVSLNSQTSTP